MAQLVYEQMIVLYTFLKCKFKVKESRQVPFILEVNDAYTYEMNRELYEKKNDKKIKR